MARPREFDYDDVIDRAMDLFWQKGFCATSIQDLVEVTGVNRGSLYSVFGNKDGLFTTALRRYVERDGIGRIIAEGEDRPLAATLNGIIDLVVDAGSKPDGAGKRGCFLTNTVVELGNTRAAPSTQLGELLVTIENMLAERFDEARTRGEIAGERDPRALARFVIASIQGMRVMAKVDPGRQVLEDIGRQVRTHVLEGARA